MSRSKGTYRGNARFIELGTLGAPFRSLINVDHITNVRFEQKIGSEEPQYDDEGKMTAPPQQYLEGWTVLIVLAHGAGGQTIMFPDEQQAINCYNSLLDMVVGTGAPMARMLKLKPQPEPSQIEGLDGQPLGEMSDAEKDALAPDDIPPLTDEELDQLENPEIDVDAIADAVDDGLGKDDRSD